MHVINLASLNTFLTSWKKHDEKKDDMKTSLIRVLSFLPQKYELPGGAGEMTELLFNWQKSQPNQLVFTFLIKRAAGRGRKHTTTKHDLTITPCFSRLANFEISGENKNCMHGYMRDYFDSIFFILRR